MGERKVLNKYFPPDFDPSKLPKGKRVRSEDKQMKVRMMLPMSVRCNTCGTFLYKGTKFNTRMEDVRGEDYLGIKIFRFYFRCTACSAEFCLKTDPKNADYEVEGGATRNYEPWRDTSKKAALTAAQREEEEKGNAMKALENRTLDSKREMDILNALDEVKSLKARQAQVDTDTALEALKRSAMAEQQQHFFSEDIEDEEAVKQMLLQRAGFVKRLSDSSDEEEQSKKNKKQKKSGKGGPAVALDLWEEEDNEQQDIDSDNDDTQQQQDNDNDSVPASAATIDDNNNNNKELTTKQQQSTVPKVSLAATKEPPPALPKFGSRPVAVVVKKKQQPAVVAVPAVAEEEEEPNGLLGLGDYGSSDSG